ncbi:branched-chain amino acid transport system permease protein [Enhydrobacter aerosaccus]|uniref:Branched-chain amino acid transport system permease protein n=1 Tax=Enhydrobacter aerosaccus TaxID=225324 RepID=A0A1T4JL02_9HYPH|nr:branched-chain amino acid ABC transporter permease [Enhydrobacter aerosaccus]SJZ30808.1 branched-chain amino acid transport system permease protein [Enhydrobacter aerosaccus]
MNSPLVMRQIREWWPVLSLAAIVTLVTAIAIWMGGDEIKVTLTEMLIRMTVVIATYLFIGNSGILSFGHIGFMCIGAYAAGWATCNPAWKQLMLTGLPAFLQENEYPFLLAVGGGGLLAAIVALIFGAAVIRLSGIAASIATFAFLAIVNSVYSNWDSVTAGTSSIIGIPQVVGPWEALAFALVSMVVAYVFQQSRYGLMLKASRDDEVAAKASAIDIVKVRLIAFVASAFLVGVGGALYGHFLGVLTVDIFYMGLTFVTLSMLVVGGIGSLFGAVSGVLIVTLIVQVLRAFEAGFKIGGATVALPQGSQEIGLGVIMALILLFRPSGLTKSREVPWPFTTRDARPTAAEQAQPAE